MFKFISKLNKPTRIILLSVLAVIIIAGGYAAVKYLFKKEIKKELLVSIAVTPNDTSETTLAVKDEITLTIPKGVITKPDTLDVYNVTNIEKPEFADELLKTYDLNFKKTENFSEGIKVELSYAVIAGGKPIDDSKGVHVMNYDENLKQWNEVDAEIDRANKKLFFYAEHFSDYGILSYTNMKPHPMMKLHERKSNLDLKSLPDVQRSQRILEGYSNIGSPTAEGFDAGYKMFEEAFNLAGQLTSLANELTGTPIFDLFNKMAGEYGLLQALRQFAIEITEGKDFEAKLNLSKNLMLYSLGKWGSQALKIANIGIFLIDYSLTKLGTEYWRITEEMHERGYEQHNRHYNDYKQTAEGWKNFIKERLSENADINFSIEARLKPYLYNYFHQKGIKCPKNIEEMLVHNERIRISVILNAAIKQAQEEIDAERRKEIVAKINEMKNMLNSELKFNVNVYGDEGEISGLPVRIVVNQDQKLWEGKTDQAGQWWTFKCTWLGYLVYKKPNTVELEYDGKILKETFTPDKYGVTVKFTLPKKEEKKEDDEEFDIQGTYSGTYTCSSENCSISGTVNIDIDAFGNTKLSASGTGGCTWSDASTKEKQTFSLKGNKPFYNKNYNGYRIHLEGNETKIVTYINAWETSTKTHSWDDRNHSIVVYKDGTIDNPNKKETYFQVSAKK